MFTKHRDAKDIFEFDFTKDLGASETLSNPQVKVAQRTGQELWTDRSAEFVQGSPTIVADKKVQFTLKVAAAGEQLAHRDYDVYVKADTSQGRILVGTTELDVVKVGS